MSVQPIYDNFDTTNFWAMRDEEAAQQKSDKRDLLLRLARCGPVSEFVALLESSSVDLDFQDQSGWTPLLHASFNGHYQIVEAILNYQKERVSGAEFERFVSRKVELNGSTCLHLAAARGHSNIVSLLIKSNQINIDTVDFDAATPLHCAVLGKHYGTAQILLRHGINTHSKDDRGKTALDWSIERNQKEFIVLLQNDNIYNHSNHSNHNNHNNYLPFHEEKSFEYGNNNICYNGINGNEYYQSQPITIHQGPRFWKQNCSNNHHHEDHKTNGSAETIMALQKDIEKQRLELNQRYQEKEKEHFREMQQKEEQIRELRHSLRQIRLFVDNLPVKQRRNFHRNFQNGNFNDVQRNKTKQKTVNNEWLTIVTTETEKTNKTNKTNENKTESRTKNKRHNDNFLFMKRNSNSKRNRLFLQNDFEWRRKN